MNARRELLVGVRQVLREKLFTEPQIEKIIPRLQDEFIKEPKHLSKVVDTWNYLLNQAGFHMDTLGTRLTPPVAYPPKNSLMGTLKINMNTILADIEPDLLLLEPDKLIARHKRVQSLGLTKNLGEEWILLYNAPRGFYLQDWVDLSKKIYYVEQKIIDFLYEKKEQKMMEVHPIVKSAGISESDFDHIRTRYLFALRSGYVALSHMFSVRMALEKPTLGDVILTDNQTYLSKFAPFCSEEEYNVFSNLMKHHALDDDDADIFEKLAELNAINH